MKHMEKLVKKLSDKAQEIVVGGPNPSVDQLENQIKEIGYVFIKFIETNGGTDLGVRIDNEDTDLSKADFINKNGLVNIVGYLVLNFVPVKCIAEINLSTLKGTGKLIINESKNYD